MEPEPFVTIGVSFQTKKPTNAWVRLRGKGDDLINLTPLDARIAAKLLNEAAEATEKMMKGEYVTVEVSET